HPSGPAAVLERLEVRGIDLDRACEADHRLFCIAHLLEHDAALVVRPRITRLELDRPIEIGQGQLELASHNVTPGAPAQRFDMSWLRGESSVEIRDRRLEVTARDRLLACSVEFRCAPV